MYERLLDKSITPTFEDLIAYSKEARDSWLTLDKYIVDIYGAQKTIRFPYGKSYGWGVKYSRKSKHICDIFAEDNAFTVFLRVDTTAFSSIESSLQEYSLDIWGNRYPCENGGWLNYRVLSALHLEDAKKIIDAKVNT